MVMSSKKKRVLEFRNENPVFCRLGAIAGSVVVGGKGGSLISLAAIFSIALHEGCLRVGERE